ncbi:hypothetical protein GCM10007100_03390 [Roseibacillus persicicus]|uniref:Uncharacterized protein n=1 Tax=Roseibacillus persicicus TaxID=454148 RepID=A0A918TCD2_9BACT|nr:hypothetical protein GCM10007100_03390 [Roseibacillus persicicus]
MRVSPAWYLMISLATSDQVGGDSKEIPQGILIRMEKKGTPRVLVRDFGPKEKCFG